MIKATGLKRGSRKKQQPQQTAVMDKEDPAQRPVNVVKQPQPVPMQQPSQQTQIQQQQTQPQPQPQEKVQQRRRQNEETAALTTKNYRLAKELAELRVRHRDECKNVTRLTMENMNLASRCREAISHVAMLKKELAMQQKRMAAALASQREQNHRMADSLSSSMELSRLSRAGSSDDVGDAKDDNLARLVTTTPSPLRASSRDSGSPASSKSTISSRPPSPPEEARDSPPADVSTSPLTRRRSSMEDDNNVAQASTVSDSPTESVEEEDTTTSIAPEKSGPGVYATPKRGDKWVPNLKDSIAKVHVDNEGGLFPHSASPQVFSTKQKLYNEEFPADIQNGKEDGSGAFPSVSSQQRKIDLLNSIDAFEQSFSVDFPDSFTPKDGKAGSGGKNRKTDIYNPFFSTPERTVGRAKKGTDSFVHRDEEEKKIDEPPRGFESDYKASNFETPPRVPRMKVGMLVGEPPRPEKSGSSAARERYQRALQPRPANSDKTSQSNSPSGLFRRNQNNHSNKQKSEVTETLNVGKETGAPTSSVVDIVDAFEGNIESAQNSDKSDRRLSLRRNVKQPISYAEPALNTKLRQGDTYFPKIEEVGEPRVVSPATVSP